MKHNKLAQLPILSPLTTLIQQTWWAILQLPHVESITNTDS